MKTTHTFLLAAVCALASYAVAAEPLSAAKDTTTIKVSRGTKPVLEYRFASVPFKPYVSQLWTPGGVQVLRDSPHDHKHHHGLMFAIEAGGVDFWSETAKNGKQVSRDPDGPRMRGSGPWFHERLDWVAPDGAVILQEQRSVCAFDEPDLVGTWVGWRSEISAAPGRGTVKLTGHHYFGLGARFLQVMDKDGEFTNASGKPGETVRGDERLVAAKWCAYSALVDGRAVTIAIFDNPQNARHPARMFMMSKPFAYLSATLNLWKEPLELETGQPLVLIYTVVVCDGKLAAAEIENLYQRWMTMKPIRRRTIQ